MGRDHCCHLSLRISRTDAHYADLFASSSDSTGSSEDFRKGMHCIFTVGVRKGYRSI